MQTPFRTLLAFVPVALALAHPAQAQTQTLLFNEQFDTSSRWSTVTKNPANSARYIGSAWQQYAPLANTTPDSFNLFNTEWGNPPVQGTGDGAEGKFLRLKLSTYNPNNFKANRATKYAFGTELQTLRTFGPPAVGHAIDYEARVRLPSFIPGLIGSFYTYSQRLNAGTVYSDEIDFEYLNGNGTGSDNSVQVVTWNDWARRNDVDLVPGQNYFDGVHHYATTVPSINRTTWHYLKVRWLRLANGQYRTEFYSKQNASDTYNLIYTENNVRPDAAMAIHLNIYSVGGAIPTSAPGTSSYMDVDWCRVYDVTLPSTATIKKTPSNPRS